jgi:hypothetical protein
MAIGLRPRKGLTGHGAASAAAIVNDHRLTKRHGKPFAQRTGQDVGGAAGGEGHKNPDRPAGKGRRLGQSGGSKPSGEKGKAGAAGDGVHAGGLLLISKTYAERCQRESLGLSPLASFPHHRLNGLHEPIR